MSIKSNASDIKPGDKVECLEGYSIRYTKGKIYTTKAIYDDQIEVTECDDGFKNDRWDTSNFKKVNEFNYPLWFQSKHSEAILKFHSKTNATIVVEGNSAKHGAGGFNELKGFNHPSWTPHTDINSWIEVENPEISNHKQKRNLAFYKKSKEHWTKVEAENICKYCGDSDYTFDDYIPEEEYFYDDGTSNKQAFMYSWSEQNEQRINECEILCYEDIFLQDLKFKVGDVIIYTKSFGTPSPLTITKITDEDYVTTKGQFSISNQHNFKLYKSSLCPETIKDVSEWKIPDDSIHRISEDKFIPTGTPALYGFISNTLKENTMTQNTTVEIKVNGKQIKLEDNLTKVPKTELEESSKYVTHWFTPEGDYSSKTSQSPKEATKSLQYPNMLGYTFITYKKITSRTTNIPTKEV
ncbi:MAG: hypothetical protein J7L15_08530 [Clostridiales bacterium]|nr:hypothetical protein [Clostridiales bacterium]